MKTELKKEVAAVYTTSALAGKRHYNGFGLYDLTEITIAQADSLYQRGFGYLSLKAKVDPKKADKAAPVVPNLQQGATE